MRTARLSGQFVRRPTALHEASREGPFWSTRALETALSSSSVSALRVVREGRPAGHMPTQSRPCACIAVNHSWRWRGPGVIPFCSSRARSLYATHIRRPPTVKHKTNSCQPARCQPLLVVRSNGCSADRPVSWYWELAAWPESSGLCCDLHMQTGTLGTASDECHAGPRTTRAENNLCLRPWPVLVSWGVQWRASLLAH